MAGVSFRFELVTHKHDVIVAQSLPQPWPIQTHVYENKRCGTRLTQIFCQSRTSLQILRLILCSMWLPSRKKTRSGTMPDYYVLMFSKT